MNVAGVVRAQTRAICLQDRTIELGRISHSRHDVDRLIERLQRQPRWAGESYQLLTNNCVHFAQLLTKELGLTSHPFPKLALFGQ